MNLADFTAFVRLLITLAALWAFAVFFWRRHAVEKFRQDMFALRDSLFDLADENRDSEFTFGRPAYEEFRKELNGIIRFAHRISFARAMVFNWTRRTFLPQLAGAQIVRNSWLTIVGIEDSALRAVLTAKMREMNWKIVKFMMKTSPVCLLLAGSVILRIAFQVLVVRAVIKTVPRQRSCVNPSTVQKLARFEVKKRASHRLRAMHTAVWVESQQQPDRQLAAA